MTLEFLELMEDLQNVQEQEAQASAPTRRKCVKSFKSRTRVFDDNSIEVTPQEQGQPAQKKMKSSGRNKLYETTGKNPLTCVELKCPGEVADKAAFFHKELAKLTKDIQISEPALPEGEYLINKDNLKLCVEKEQHTVQAWLKFNIEGKLDIRKELYLLTSEIDKCFAFNADSILQQN